MEKSTKLCITTIIVALIWFSAQPIGGNMSVEANFDKVPYFNLTNSTISGHTEISGYMPIGIMLPMLIADSISSEQAMFLYFTIISLSIMFCVYKIVTKVK